MKHEFWVQWGGLGAFIAKNSDTTSWHELLHHFGLFCTEFCTATKRSQMHPKSMKTHQNVSLEANVVDQVRSLRKIPTRLRGMNFCTRLAHFALSVVTQPNSPKCTQIVRSAPKHKVSVQWGGSNGLLWKILTRLHGPNFCTTSRRFAPSFVRQRNGTKCTSIVRNAPKHEFRCQWGQSGVFVAKNYDATSWHELFHQFGPFCT